MENMLTKLDNSTLNWISHNLSTLHTTKKRVEKLPQMNI